MLNLFLRKSSKNINKGSKSTLLSFLNLISNYSINSLVLKFINKAERFIKSVISFIVNLFDDFLKNTLD